MSHPHIHLHKVVIFALILGITTGFPKHQFFNSIYPLNSSPVLTGSRSVVHMKTNPAKSENTHSISEPLTPEGPTDGLVDKVYTFRTGDSTCSFGHDVQYQWFVYGKGNYVSSQLDIKTIKISWATAGTHFIKARAECAVDNRIKSNLSNIIKITIRASRSWIKFSWNNPETVVAGDINGNGSEEVIADYVTKGLW
jgi:hypothetical protein